MFLTGRTIAGVILLSVPAVILPLPRYLSFGLLNLIIVVLVVRDVLVAPKSESLSPSLILNEVTTMGVLTNGEVVLRNDNQGSVMVGVSLQSLPSLGLEPRRSAISLKTGDRRSVEFKITPARRGNFVIGPVTLRLYGPLGLAGKQTVVPITTRLKVYPPLPGRKQVSLRIQRARMLQVGERSTAIRGGGTAFDSLRDYHSDDEFRRINWKATARATRPISNVFTEERNQQIILLLDAARTMATNVEGISKFEHAIDAAVAVSDLAAYMGDHVGMVAFAADMVAMIPPRSGKQHSKRILDSVFAVTPSLEAANYRRAFAALLSRYRRRALLLLLTGISDESSMDSLFASLPSIASRHLVIVGSVNDPVVEALEVSVPVSSEDAYLKAAAAESLVAKQLTISRLSALGVTVVDRTPQDLAGHLVDEYLRVKAYGRL